MGRNVAVVGVAAWLILLAALFLYYQFGPFVIENRAPTYLMASLKVAAVLIAYTAFGLRLLGGRDITGWRCLQGLALGLALLAVAGFAVAALGILSPYVVYILVAAAAALSYRQVGAVFRAAKRAGVAPLQSFEAAFAALAAVALVIALINCLSPVTANDALVYHLNLPKVYCAQGGFASMPANVYANMPHYGEVLFSVLYSVAGETGVTLFYFAMLVAAAAAVGGLVMRTAPRVFGILAGGALLVQPLVLDHRVVGNIDMLMAFTYIAAIGVVLDGAWKEGRWRTIAAVSVLAGFMMGVKYTGVAPALSLLVLVLLLRHRALRARHLAAGFLIAVVILAPWLVRQAVNTGNPVYPVLEGRFDGANWDSIQSEQLRNWQSGMGMGRGPARYLALPFNVSVRGRPGLNYVHFDGTISPVFLVLFPLVFIRPRRETMALALMAAGLGLFWAFTSQQLRFLLPALALFAALGGIGLSSVHRWVKPLFLGIIFIEIVTLATPNQYGRSWVGDAVGDRLGAALGLESRERFLERTVQPFTLYREADATLPRGEPVFMIWENRAYHLDRPYFADSFFEASTVLRMTGTAGTAEDLRNRIEGMGYRYVLVNDLLGEVFSRRYPREDILRLREFIDTHLEPVHSANRVTLYRMK